MELVIKALAVIIVLAVVSVLLWSFVAKTQSDISNEETAAAAAAADSNRNGSFYGYFGYPSTTVYVTDASGSYWKRFYSN